ncbi:MAG: hypothetical protein U9Q38_10040 [Thermodesulfobacteriota bacterium]|nr:hypothetical protein [Thermodesulfobacteriota bacterium]
MNNELNIETDEGNKLTQDLYDLGYRVREYEDNMVWLRRFSIIGMPLLSVNGNYEEEFLERRHFDIIRWNESRDIPKRWRAKKGNNYFRITTSGLVVEIEDLRWHVDDKFWNIGNYFKEEEEARLYQEKVNNVFKDNV